MYEVLFLQEGLFDNTKKPGSNSAMYIINMFICHEDVNGCYPFMPVLGQCYEILTISVYIYLT